MLNNTKNKDFISLFCYTQVINMNNKSINTLEISKNT